MNLKIFLMILLLCATSFFVGRYVKSPATNDAASKTASQKPGERKILFYRNPMNPAITSPAPAKDEMGMDYIPVYEDEGSQPKKTAEQEAEDFFSEDAEIPGLTKVTLSSHGIQMAGLQSAAAVREPFRMSIRTVGRVIADETRVRRVQTKTEGWIEKLYVNFTGQAVKKDDPVLSIYSPELLSGQTEFLQAIETASKMMTSSDPETRKSGESLLKSARRRLELFDVPEKFIETLKKTGKPQRSVTLTAPVSGFVTVKEVFEGQKAEPGMMLFTVTDLSTIWVDADFYEFEAGALRIGQDAVLSSPYQPGTERKGKIAYIYPYLNTESRTIRARLEFQNENMMLKPGMFADVSVETDLGESVVIPDSAVMDSGVRKVVFVDKGEGAYDPREVRVGARQGGKTQILSGIKPDEKVVVKANFLLDSESRLQAIIQGKTHSGGGQ